MKNLYTRVIVLLVVAGGTFFVTLITVLILSTNQLGQANDLIIKQDTLIKKQNLLILDQQQSLHECVHSLQQPAPEARPLRYLPSNI